MRPATSVIVNTNARRLRREPELAARIAAVTQSRAELSITGTLQELDEAARAARVSGAERVVLCGGDGTLMAGVSALARAGPGRELPELVVAPAGTVATVARNWGQRSGPLETVERALNGALPAAIERPTLLVSETGGSERIGFQIGTGLVARFFDRYYAGGAGGYRAAARIVLRVFVGSFVADAYSKSVLDPLECIVSVDGRELEPRAFSLVFSSVVRDAGLHMLVAHRAGEDPHRPHLVAAPLAPRRLGPQAPRVLAGKPLIGPGCFDDLVTEFRLRFSDGGGPYVLDGDVFRAHEVTVRAGPVIRVATV